MRLNYYNDFEPFVCGWLTNLISAGHLPQGDVDGRSICDIEPGELRGYRQCHFFAGIGGWPYALQLAGWPEDKEIWTGSCPCQPFSAAGKRKALQDERDLWPAFFRLVAECRPEHIFGEQVESAIADGWLDRICDDLGGEGYTVRAAVLPACSVGAPHRRYRLFWVATANHRGERIQRFVQGAVSGQRAFSWCENVRSVEDLRLRSDVPQPLIRSYSDGFPSGMECVRAYGNAIVPQVAAEFIRAFMVGEV